MTILQDGYRVPFLDSPPPLSRTPVSFPTYQAGSPRAQALRQEVEGMLAKGALEITRDPGPGFYSRLFLVKASGGWRPVISLSHMNEFVQLTRFKMETVASVLLSVREGAGSERRVLSDPDPSIFEEAIEVHIGGDGLPVPSPVFRTVDCSPGLHQGRGRVSVGTHSRDQTSPLSGQLVGSLLLGSGSQAGRPVAPLALSHPRDCDKREEVGSRALADCEVSRHDHRYRGQQGFSVSGASREIPDGCGELLYHGRSSSSALAGDPRSPGFARAAGSSRSPSDAHFTVASEGALVPRVRSSLSSGALATGSETGPVLVDGEVSSVDGGSIWDTCSGSSPVFLSVLFGMGRSPSRSTRVQVVVRPGVVRILTTSTDPTTSRPALVGQSASAAPLQPLPPRRPRAEPSRVVTLKRHFRKSGFLGRAAGVLSGCLRSSTSRLYQSRWQIFCGWCRGRGVAPVNASVPVVVDFLIHLRHDKGLSVSAVKGYSSALNSVLALKGWDLASSREITMLLRSFSRSIDPVKLRPPAWDVALVLQSLTGAPYEPLRTGDERFLAQETLFLLALASAKCIGELHALSYHVSHARNWVEVSFSFVPGFVAKTQDPSSLAPRFEGFTVPALPNARNNRNGRLLCPVRAVRCYLDRTAAHVRVVTDCLSPQGVARRRYRRPLSPSGSGRRYRMLMSFLVRNNLFLPLELVRHVVSLRLFFSRRTSLSTRC